LKDAGISTKDVDELHLVGGMTRVPKVHESAQMKLWPSMLPFMVEFSVEMLRSFFILDATPLSLGPETLGGIFVRLINRNTRG
jgi:molecular chaperone DnaK